ncbi:hypothetical protein [Streptomyces sp. 142MFCol3.1]|uniref:hypothetical protein n=1 Tax=Streptomyces sp. 142MFCol3.1 TaxID=1172179 RepID=UPI00048D6745|nr:hypothetical protein [Streptomyces sp. 142MFCol3.1]
MLILVGLRRIDDIDPPHEQAPLLVALCLFYAEHFAAANTSGMTEPSAWASRPCRRASSSHRTRAASRRSWNRPATR